MYAYAAATLSFYCGMRACEIKGLRWQDLDWTNRLLHIRRSKTPAGWRSPTLNPTCLQVLQHVHEHATALDSRSRPLDGRQTAITTPAEKGLPDWVIQSQVGTSRRR